MGYRKIFMFLIFFLTPSIYAGDLTIESIDGDEVVTVVIEGIKVNRRAGDTLTPGDEIETSEFQSVNLVSEDGSSIGVAEKTNLMIEKQIDVEHSFHLKSGGIRGIIQKKIDDQKNKLRYTFRTRSATLGVRGTDFIVNEDYGKEETEFHTLDGSVEIAKNREELFAGKGVSIRSGMTLRSGRRGLGKARKFDRKKFLKKFAARHPHLSNLKHRKKNDQTRQTREMRKHEMKNRMQDRGFRKSFKENRSRDGMRRHDRRKMKRQGGRMDRKKRRHRK